MRVRKVAAGKKPAENLPTVPTDGFRVVHSDLHLVVLGHGPPVHISLQAKHKLLIGRDVDADVRIDHRAVSKRHAELVCGPGGATLQDLDSMNGVRIDDKPIGREPVVFLPGEIAVIGPVVLMLQVMPRLERDGAFHGEKRSQSGVILSEGMAAVNDLAARAADSKMSVFITGETGVGKDRLARWIHDHSPRSRGPFVEVELPRFSDSLIESELFGHKKGAFTNAFETRVGLLESANGGTVFLNEVGDLPLSLQPKLLRVLETQIVRRVGENIDRPIDVRWVAATNRDLPNLVATERFRADLYYRLAVVELAVPPLRERSIEIEPLARLFLRQWCEENGRPLLGLSEGALFALKSHDWPGNVRELRKVIGSAVVRCLGSEILADDVQKSIKQLPTVPPEPISSGYPDRERILAALANQGWNRDAAAEELGISRTTLWKRMNDLQIQSPHKSKKPESA